MTALIAAGCTIVGFLLGWSARGLLTRRQRELAKVDRG